jgi:hypothetical protein
MIRARYAVGAVGLLGTVIAVALVYAPTAMESSQPVELLTEALPTERPGVLIAGIGLVVGLAASVLSRFGTRESVSSLVTAPPEHATASAPRTGGRFDYLLAHGDDDLHETIRTTAVETLVQQTGRDRQDARTAVERGTWTDDRLARALLGTPGFPLLSRLRAWLDPEAERQRRVRRTVAAIERVHEGSTGPEERP